MQFWRINIISLIYRISDTGYKLLVRMFLLALHQFISFYLFILILSNKTSTGRRGKGKSIKKLSSKKMCPPAQTEFKVQHKLKLTPLSSVSLRQEFI